MGLFKRKKRATEREELEKCIRACMNSFLQEFKQECRQECKQECGQECRQESMQEYFGESVQGGVRQVIREEGQMLPESAESRLEFLTEEISGMKKQMKRQSEAVEDLMDEWQEKETAAEDYRRRLQEKQKREEMFLRLICDWQKQWAMLEERVCREPMADVTKQEAWQKQFRLLKEQTAVQEKLCGIEEVGAEGERIDYRIHEIIRALETEKEDAGGTVARVHRRGLMYEGKIIAKAEVDAYKL